MANHWATLPPAIIGLVLNHVAREAAMDHTLARYAAVNKDWQYLFEQFTFRSINLSENDLPKFGTLISTHSDRRKWLRTVSFHVVDCACVHLDGGAAKSLPEYKVSQAVASLLCLLETWDTDGNLRLTLCFSAPTSSSPESGRGTRSHRKSAAIHSVDRLHQSEKDALGHSIEQILAIKSFSIRYREGSITSSRALIKLCSKLPGLEELCLQDVHHHNEHIKYFQIAELTPKFPTTLKRLHVLGQGGKDSKGVCRFLVQRLVWFGMRTRLQELSITTSENAAEEFFENLRNFGHGSSNGRTCHWPALQSLTLTCSLLKPGTPHAAINRLLHQGGMAALDLPMLQELRLLSYNTRKWGEIDGLFRYVVKGQKKDIATCFGESAQYSSNPCLTSLTDIAVSEHIHVGRLVTDTWRNVAWESHRAVLQFSSSANSQSPPLTLEGLSGEHGGSAFENTQYPRPHWTASEGIRSLLGGFVFFMVLVSFLTFLVTQMPRKEQDRGNGLLLRWQ